MNLLKHAILGISTGLTLSFLAIRAPSIHSSFLRNKVGIAVTKVMRDAGRGGTGFQVITPSGKEVIVTNKHVCGDEKHLTVIIDNEPSLHQVIATSKVHDLCIIEGSNRLSSISLSSNPEIGDTVAIVGHPMLTPLQISRGEINGFTPGMTLPFLMELDILPLIPVYWTSAASYPGNSGSPVIDFFGNVVGILFAGAEDHINMIIPVSSLKKFLEDK